MKVYFFNGIGNNSAIFSKLKLNKSIQPVFVIYPNPEQKEKWEAYIKRLSKIIDVNEPFALVGLSFGGLVITELSKILNPQKLVYISSITTRKELPLFYKLSGNWRLYYLLPGWFKPRKWMFNLKLIGLKSETDRAILMRIFQTGEPRFTKWAIRQVITWNNDIEPKNYIKIHGTKDDVLPLKNETYTTKIMGANHFMVLTHNNEVSAFLNQHLT